MNIEVCVMDIRMKSWHNSYRVYMFSYNIASSLDPFPSAKVVIMLGAPGKDNTTFVKAFKCKWMTERNVVRSQFECMLLESHDCT